MDIRWPVPNRPRQFWRYGGAWDTDNPYMPSHLPTKAYKVESGFVKETEEKSSSSRWLLILACFFVILALMTVSRK